MYTSHFLRHHANIYPFIIGWGMSHNLNEVHNLFNGGWMCIDTVSQKIGVYITELIIICYYL